MKIFVALAIAMAAFFSFAQTRISVSVGGSLPFGVALEVPMLKSRLVPEIGIGFVGAWGGASYQFVEGWRIGASHSLQMVPSVGGWRTFPYVSHEWHLSSMRLEAGAGPRLDWFDRKPYAYPMAFVRFRRK